MDGTSGSIGRDSLLIQKDTLFTTSAIISNSTSILPNPSKNEKKTNIQQQEKSKKEQNTKGKQPNNPAGMNTGANVGNAGSGGSKRQGGGNQSCQSTSKSRSAFPSQPSHGHSASIGGSGKGNQPSNPNPANPLNMSSQMYLLSPQAPIIPSLIMNDIPSSGGPMSSNGIGIGNIGGIPNNIHPAIGKLGLLYAKHKIMGGNARCIAMLEAFKQVIKDYITPSHTSLNRHLDSYFKPLINYLVNCRPLSVSMGNAIRHIKCEIASLPHELTEEEVRHEIFPGSSHFYLFFIF
jgi:translation initiation factor eIF-2B subunit delta